MKNDYYKIKHLIDEPNKNFELAIEWNVQKISNETNANGFIVQHMDINSSHKSIPSNNYYEAWLVKDGIISEGDKTYHWDDKWAAPYEYLDEDISNIEVNFSSKVYWIPCTSKIFQNIVNWERKSVIEAGELRSCRKIKFNIEPYFVLNRNYTSTRKK